MKTRMFILALLFAGLLHAADDPFVAIRTALAQNQLDAADAALVPLVAAEKPDPRAWLYLSRVRARQQRTKEAISLAEKAVAAEPNQAEYHSNLGSILGQRAGEVNFMQQALLAGRMLEAFKKAVALDPEHIGGYIGLARYYTNAPAFVGGGREPAEQYAREVGKRNAQLGTIELARIAEHFDDPGRAYELYTSASSTQPDAAWIHEALGRLSEKLQRRDDARTHYASALALEPSHARAKEALARLDGNASR